MYGNIDSLVICIHKYFILFPFPSQLLLKSVWNLGHALELPSTVDYNVKPFATFTDLNVVKVKYTMKYTRPGAFHK